MSSFLKFICYGHAFRLDFMLYIWIFLFIFSGKIPRQNCGHWWERGVPDQVDGEIFPTNVSFLH